MSHLRDCWNYNRGKRSKFAGDDISDDDITNYFASGGETDLFEEVSDMDEPIIQQHKVEDCGLPTDCELHTQQLLKSSTSVISKDLMSDEIRWKTILSSIGVHKEPHELLMTDIIGKSFNSLEEAGYFFNLYAKFIGFSVRKGHMRRRKNGLIMLREWKCSREGRREQKYSKMVNRKREPRAITRVGCKVVFRVVQLRDTTKWIAKQFITEHSHDLAQRTHVQFLRSNRVLSGGDLHVARTMKSAGIRTCQIMTFMAQQSGGYENMKYIIKDLYNHIGNPNAVQLADVDASRAMGYLEHKADHDPSFFGKYSYDDEGRLGNVVWADSRCQSDYACFGHAIAFDTTYRTNGYGKPLLIWIGINHHFKTIVLGFAIMINEIVETYEWVTQAFLECMNGVMPKTVVTDGDLAIRAAIAKLMPNARHRLCCWHIQNKAVLYVKDPDFLPRLKKMIYRYYTEEEFNKELFKMVDDFGLHKNAWVQQMYERRKTWAEAYLRGLFFVGMTTTERSEGINALLKKRLSTKLRLWEFVRSIDLALSWLRHKEAKDDFDTYNSKPVLEATNMKEVEAQAAEVYSRNVYFKVRKQLKKEGKYIVKETGSENNIDFFELTKYGEIDCKRRVQYMREMDLYECGCNYFPTFGFPCRHIFATMKYQHVKCIPTRMIVSQWTMRAKRKSLHESNYAPRCKYTCSEASTRFGVIQNWTTDIAFVAGKSNKLFQLAVSLMSRAHKVLLKELEINSHTLNEETNINPKQVEVRNPLYTKTKGTASAKGGPGGGKRKCSRCNKYGHNKATCKNGSSKKIDKVEDMMDFDDEDVNINDDSYPCSQSKHDLNEASEYYLTTEEAFNIPTTGTILKNEQTSKSMEEGQWDDGNNSESLMVNTLAYADEEEYMLWWGKPFGQ